MKLLLTELMSYHEQLWTVVRWLQLVNSPHSVLLQCINYTTVKGPGGPYVYQLACSVGERCYIKGHFTAVTSSQERWVPHCQSRERKCLWFQRRSLMRQQINPDTSLSRTHTHTYEWNINQFTAQKYKGWQTGFLENSTWFCLFNYWWAELRLLNDTPLAVGERKGARLEEKRGGEKRGGIKRSVVEGGRERCGQRASCPSSLLISWLATAVEDALPQGMLLYDQN